jgi:hypothetical protein
MVLKATFCIRCNVGDANKMVPTLLSIHTLDLQVFFLKMTMCCNFEHVICEENDLNPSTKLWHKVFGYLVFNHKLLKFIELAKIGTIEVLGFVEDERTFNTVNFMKIRLWNQLSMHLDLCTRFRSQHFFSLQTIP